MTEKTQQKPLTKAQKEIIRAEAMLYIRRYPPDKRKQQKEKLEKYLNDIPNLD